MTDWPVKTLGEVAVVGAGNSAPQDKELFRNGVHRFVRTSDVGQVRIGRLDQSADLLNDEGTKGLRKFRAGVTLMPKSGASTFLNHRVQLTKPCFVSSHLAVVDPNPELMDDTFMFYFLQTVRSQDLIQDQSYPSLNLPAISGINVLVPPLEEQKRIVELLDAANARVTELTACYEQARTHANNLFTSALRDALESNPDWPVKTLGDLCDIYQPQTIGTKDLIADGKYIVYGANGPIGRYDRFNHEKSEVTVTCRGATCGTVNVTPPEVWITGNAMVVRPNDMEMSKEMMRYVLEGLDYSRIITGAAQPQITRQTLAPSMIQVPPLEEQKQIVTRLDSMRAKTSEMVAAYDAKLTAAKNLRQSILEAAFAGDL